MNLFIQKHEKDVIGQLSGFDRLILRGTPGPLRYAEGMNTCLCMEGINFQGFKDFALAKTEALVEGTERFAASRGRPIIWLDSPSVDKDDVVRGIARKDGVENGLICVLKTIEPCWTFKVVGNRKTHKLELKGVRGKCAFFYHYAFHPVWGLCYARIQTWLPFPIQVYLNGREWLAKSLDREGVAYKRADNTFTWIADLARAQALLDEQPRADMKGQLEQIARLVNPTYPKMFEHFNAEYAWTIHQSELATDTMFSDSSALRAIYPGLVRQGIVSFSSPDGLRFLGGARRTTKDGNVRENFAGEVTSDFKHRAEGVRVKHTCNSNSVKVYDKAETVLRVETTINRPHDIKVMRPKQGDPDGELKLRPLRKNVADLPQLAEVSRQSNERYLDALAGLRDETPLERLAGPLASPAQLDGRRVRALNPHAVADLVLLRAVNRGEFAINGFRNRDLLQCLHSDPANETERRRLSASVARRVRILRGHGLVERLPHSHRYQLTQRGRQLISPLLAAMKLDVTRIASVA